MGQKSVKIVCQYGALALLFSSLSVAADENWWLRSVNHEQLSVVANFEDCKALEVRGKEILEAVLTFARIDYLITDSAIVHVVDDNGKAESYLFPKHVFDEKPYLAIEPSCHNSDQGRVLFSMNIGFAYVKYDGQPGIHPKVLYFDRGGSVGLVSSQLLPEEYRRVIENQITQYLKANKSGE